METFSGLAHSFKEFEKAAQNKSQMQAAKPFPDADMIEERRVHRLSESARDFWKFDGIYFPTAMYSDGFSQPAKFHKDLVKIADTPGVQVVAGPRKHGKTATIKKLLIYRLLTGQLRYAAVASSVLEPNARNILSDIATLIRDNPRIMYDYKVVIDTDNADQFSFYVEGLTGKRIVEPFSEGRSVRSASSGFDRPQFILYDDLETRTTPIGGEHTKSRIRLLGESYQSLVDNGTLVCLGNNFDRSGYINVLLEEQKKNIIGQGWKVHVYKAWEKGKPLWKSRYPCKTEAELRAKLKPLDEAEWQGDFQQNPIPPDGFYFKRPHHEYDGALPSDCKGVIFADPNLSLTGQGDTGAIVVYLHSAKNQKYYIPELRCKSYSNSNELVESYFELYQRYKKYIFACGWDGNVTQEATWTNFIRNWCQLNDTPFPRIEYKRYKVDLLAKNVKLGWDKGDIVFHKSIARTDEGKVFLNQVFAFSGKTANKKDDGPDVMISAHELAHERHLVRLKASTAIEVFTLTNSYSF